MHLSLSYSSPEKTDFEGQSVIKASSYLLPFVLEAHRESLPRSCETSARRLSAESAEVYSTADLPASAAHISFSLARRIQPTRPPSACSFSIFRLNLVLPYGIPPEFRGGVQRLA